LKRKNKRIIEDNSFILSNTNFIVPIAIGQISFIEAGATIYKKVPDNNLTIERNK
jgi:bifunctional UDP-N-acetylglucosamine pyrophosphorylase/glucosamine-1-phosphate N-acetyltransferase